MVTQVSPGVNVQVLNESFYVPASPSTVPLIILATADNKLQPDGSSPAIGTYEHGVLRTVTSVTQALQLYGVPGFRTDANGAAQHGDARNEYGLDALVKFLQVANVVYVVRANVNLDDSYDSIKTLWDDKIADAADLLNSLVAAYIEEYNNANGFVPADAGYKESVTHAEMTTLTNEAVASVLASYSFSSSQFSKDYLQDHTQDHAGFQDAVYDSTSGYIQTTDNTGLTNDSTLYGFELAIVSSGGTASVQVSVQGQDAQTFGDLVSQLQTAIQTLTSSSTTVELIQGRIRVTSDLEGATSSVSMSDGYSGVTALFASTNLFDHFDDAVPGQGIQSLDVYNSDFTIVIGSYDGLYAIINNWNSGSVVAAEFTPQEAEGLLVSASSDFSSTKEFKNTTSLGANDAARREEIVKQLKAVVLDPTTPIRSDRLQYNLIACPGYHEVNSTLQSVSDSVFNEIMVVGEAPMDKAPTGPNGMTEWASSAAKLVSEDAAIWYPHGLSTNVDGETIMSTAATIALRVIANSDQQSEVFYAPAGPNRGVVTFVDNIGYVSGTLGTATTFVENDIDQGTRDVLYQIPNTINPISYIPGRGIIVMGQKTTTGTSSAMDRINVSRLVKLIKRDLRKSLFSYLFEPNDQITRDNVKATTDSYLGNLLGRRALYDFASQCDSGNNTPDTIDRNELYIDIAIKPTKTAEFIYVKLKLVNTGANISGR